MNGDDMELWVFRIIALVILALALGLFVAGVVKASGNTPGEATPAPPPAATEVPAYTADCIQHEAGYCGKYVIYRRTSY